MKHSIKRRILGLPILGYTVKVISNGLRSPKHRSELNQKLDNITQEVHKINKVVASTIEEADTVQDKLSNLVRSRDNLQQQMSLLQSSSVLGAGSTKSTGKQKPSKSAGKLFADDHLLDVFYTEFEDRFRGSEETIKKRLVEYLPDFKACKVDFQKYPVVDIGSGRGEFLQFLKENNIAGRGIDINIDMVERSKAKGLNAVQGDAVDYLQQAKAGTFGAITGFHIVEHIPFNVLLRLFSAAHKSLAEDGFVLFETPNPENIIVGSCGFYMDPSHLHPLPPDLLAFALETSGFRKVEIRRIHPVDHKDAGKVPAEFINRFYGSRDYAVLGYK